MDPSVAPKFRKFSNNVWSWVDAAQDGCVFNAPSMNGLFQMFESSQFLNVVDESDESDEKLDGDDRLYRNIVRAEAFGSDGSAGHKAEIER